LALHGGDDGGQPDDRADQRENAAEFVAQRLEAEVTTASEKFIVLGELNRIGVGVDASAMKGPHPVVPHTPHDQIDVFLRAGSLFLRPRTVPRYPWR